MKIPPTNVILAYFESLKKKHKTSLPLPIGMVLRENGTSYKHEVCFTVFVMKFSFQPYINIIKLAEKLFHKSQKNTRDEFRKFRFSVLLSDRA